MTQQEIDKLDSAIQIQEGLFETYRKIFVTLAQAMEYVANGNRELAREKVGSVLHSAPTPEQILKDLQRLQELTDQKNSGKTYIPHSQGNPLR